jgi:hypothetical protein
MSTASRYAEAVTGKNIPASLDSASVIILPAVRKPRSQASLLSGHFIFEKS